MTPRDRLMRLSDVMNRTGIGPSYIYRLMSEGKFPPSTRVGKRAVRWSENAIEAWVKAREGSAVAS